jgi:hypothetical protein
MNLGFDHISCPNVFKCCSVSITKSNNTYTIEITVKNTGGADDQAWFTLWYQEPCGQPPALPVFDTIHRQQLVTLVGLGIGNGTNNVGPVLVRAGTSVTSSIAWQPSPDVHNDTSILVQVADQPNVENAPINPALLTNAQQVVACADPV